MDISYAWQQNKYTHANIPVRIFNLKKLSNWSIPNIRIVRNVVGGWERIGRCDIKCLVVCTNIYQNSTATLQLFEYGFKTTIYIRRPLRIYLRGSLSIQTTEKFSAYNWRCARSPDTRRWQVTGGFPRTVIVPSRASAQIASLRQGRWLAETVSLSTVMDVAAPPQPQTHARNRSTFVTSYAS